jgi:hypothetical protein
MMLQRRRRKRGKDQKRAAMSDIKRRIASARDEWATVLYKGLSLSLSLSVQRLFLSLDFGRDCFSL